MIKPLIADAPYPSTDGILRDVCQLKIISPAYATSTGELNAIMQYIYHSLIFSANGRTEDADTIKSIAIAEMLHLDLLRLYYCPRRATDIYSQPTCGV
jgi:hypothetical protein